MLRHSCRYLRCVTNDNLTTATCICPLWVDEIAKEYKKENFSISTINSICCLYYEKLSSGVGFQIPFFSVCRNT